MLQVNEARKRLLEYFSPGESETVLFSHSLGRVLAENIHADLDSPLFTHSAMDGIAVKAADIRMAGPDNPVSLKIVGKITAGDKPEIDLQSGEAVLIMTGAASPESSDAVVRVEDTDLDFSEEFSGTEAKIYQAVLPGENLRFKGENYTSGSAILRAGQQIFPQDVGMLAMLGREYVSVYAKPVVGVFSSGDELVEPGTPLRAGQIWNSNSHMLTALVENCGGQVINLGIVPDTEVDILDAFERLKHEKVDLIITSGGVSMGVHDYVRRVIEKHGELDFWKVNMRPGKPLAFGSFRGTRFVGLPGNPVSSFVAFVIFVCPAIKKMAGFVENREILSQAKLCSDFNSDGRESYLPGFFKKGQNGLRVELSGNQSSGNLYALVQSNCLIKIPPGVQSVRRDSVVNIYKISTSDIDISYEGE